MRTEIDIGGAGHEALREALSGIADAVAEQVPEAAYFSAFNREAKRFPDVGTYRLLQDGGLFLLLRTKFAPNEAGTEMRSYSVQALMSENTVRGTPEFVARHLAEELRRAIAVREREATSGGGES